MKSLLVLISLLFSNQSGAAETTSVIFFGGYGSSQKQMSCWEDGAQKNSSYSGYSFKGIPYPAHAGADMASAVSGGAQSIGDIVHEINQNPNEHYVIVGHSSGAALANQVAKLVKNPNQIELVDLDGFTASASLQKKVKTTCVYAVNQSTGLQSRNASGMRSCKNAKLYSDSHCKTQWCLHFSLVNTQTPASLGSSDFKGKGYAGCSTNLSWLSPKTSENPTQDRQQNTGHIAR